MSDGVGFSQRVDMHAVTPGWRATLQREDGTGLSAWGRTKHSAVANLRSEVEG